SSLAAAVAGHRVPPARTGHGLHGGAGCGDFAAGAGGVSLAALGKSAGSGAGGFGQRVSGFGEFPDLFRGTAVDHLCGAAVSECAAVSVRLGAVWPRTFVSERRSAVCGGGGGPSCHAAVRVVAVRAARAGAGDSRWTTRRGRAGVGASLCGAYGQHFGGSWNRSSG